MLTLPIRTDKHGVLRPLVNRLTSGHRSYRIAVSTAKRRAAATGIPMAIVTWHNETYVVMSATDGRAYDEHDLLVEFV